MRIGHHIALTTIAAAVGGLVVTGVLWHTYSGFQKDAEEVAVNALVLRDADHLDGTKDLFVRHADAVGFLADGLDAKQATHLSRIAWANWGFLQSSLGDLLKSGQRPFLEEDVRIVRGLCLDICHTIDELRNRLQEYEARAGAGLWVDPLQAERELEQLSSKLLDFNQELADHAGTIGPNLEAFARLRIEELEGRRQELEKRVLVTLGAYLLASLLLWLWSSRRIASPIARLSRAAVDASRGGTDFKFNGPANLTEVRTLGDSVASFVRKLEGNRDQLEEEVARRTEELSRANEAKSEFLAHMSHELRTPMSAILGFGELLQTENPSQDQLTEYSESILRNARHLLALLNDILDLSKIEAGQMSPECVTFEPRKLAEEVHGLLAARAMEKGIDFFLEVDDAVPGALSSDPTRLRQVLINLCGNAIKFTAEGGVRLSLKHEFDGDKSRLVCRVVDSGIGIPTSKVTSIFEAFAQADSSTTRRFGGTGLGLAISRRLARILGGDLSVESREGLGSTFELMIAADVVELEVEESAAKAGASAAFPSIPARFSGRVLVVDDVPVNRRLMTIQLERLGLELATASNGLRAIEAIEDSITRETPFDVVLMDMQMPEMDGYEATGKLRAAGVRVPIYALTAHAMSGDRERCLAAGCDGYLTKPVDRGALIQALMEVLGEQPSDEQAA